MTAYRCIFALAALYNIAFGIWAGFFPQSFFTRSSAWKPRVIRPSGPAWAW
jgi:hypothetical protein